MNKALVFDKGNYRFVPTGVHRYSAGVAAQPGYEICRVVFSEPVPLNEGFAIIQAVLEAEERPLTALCACELRSPEPANAADFSSFNETYVQTLSDWGLIKGKHNPVARCNVSPLVGAPAEPSFYAFSYTVETDIEESTFVISGSCEVPEVDGDDEHLVVAYRDVSPQGMLKKAEWVLDEMERRMQVLGFEWADTTATHAYTVHDVHAFMASELARRGAIQKGLGWHLARPPVVDLEYEMDCRRILNERVLVID
ncbi:2-amino-5-chloromuconate deaminase CnbZ [Alcaligenes sp. SDU_A2]|uniref:2-amino-5-chloromuconate deaminase CnbZ n=1 Tax=Alcaligenes sp. SDU_A2 TaxID=3136634 RepID=UPI00311DE965